MNKEEINNSKPIITIIQGDITTMQVDAIVNAANTSLLGGGGVDGAIHRVGGPQILADCIAIRAKQDGCKTGEAVITSAGNLTAKYVIHTPGPKWNGDSEEKKALLKNCYINCLRLAEKHNVSSIAFPSISTGIYRFPKDVAAAIAIDAIENYTYSSIKKIIFVCFDAETFELYQGMQI
jgi:O-acetyl-ADP-ribose deacetylase